MYDALWIDAQVATMRDGGEPYGALADAAIATADGCIAWVGLRSALPGPPERLARTVHDARGRWITPALIDCHTHLVHAGNRANEFELRLQGATYEQIALAGGGIASTVAATRAATEDALVASAARRARQWQREGATVVEIKSGYGLDRDTEAKQLRAARRVGESVGLTVRTTYLGAHALPLEYRERDDDYVDLVCDDVLPRLAAEGLADAVDAFCDRIGFSAMQTRRIFDAARRHGLPVKLHADQLSDVDGAALAAACGALSADHLEYTNERGAAAMGAAGTVAVLLPGAFYFLHERRLPPIDAFRRHRVPIAFATDYNPGSSPLTSPLLAMNLACTLFRVTPLEALAGMTVNAALALGLQATHGTIEPGKQADFAIWDVGRPAELAYGIGSNPCVATVRAGRVAYAAD